MFITVQCRIFCETKQHIYIFPNNASNQYRSVCHQKGEDMHFLDYYAMYIRSAGNIFRCLPDVCHVHRECADHAKNGYQWGNTRR